MVRCSYLEIYNEKILDLLGGENSEQQNLDVKQDKQKGIFVQGLKQVITKSISEIQQAMDAGNKNRKVGATAMNATSSRSHSIFTIYVEMAEEPKEGDENVKAGIRAGKLHLVDLAGSERQSKTNAEGKRLEEAKSINLSLSALGDVIKALVSGKSAHIPYRNSKLTRLLQDSLGGNTKTAMIAAISPADYNYDETISTLRYADRAKQIKNKPKINEDPKDSLLRQYEEEITQLKMMLQQMGKGGQMPQGDQIKQLMAMQTNMPSNDVEESVDVLMAKLKAKGHDFTNGTPGAASSPAGGIAGQMEEISQMQ